MAIGISVVIPCYNATKYINRCLNSFDYSYINYEIIIVDDCSKDDSVSKIQKFQDAHNANIILLTNKVNMGPGSSRNKGIVAASKEYITFVDIDDTVESNYFQKIDKALHNKTDCLIFDVNRIYKNKSIYMQMFFSKPKLFRKGYIDKKSALVYVRPAPFGKVYKTDLIKNNTILFGDTKRGEDHAFGKIAVALSSYPYYLNEALYNYYNNEGSLIHQKIVDNSKIRWKIYEQIKTSIDVEYYKNELNTLYFFYIIFFIINEKIKNNDSIKECKKVYDQLSKKYCVNDKYIKAYLPKFRICFFLIRKKCFLLLKILYKIYQLF